jgi:ubiquitin carboxyl-terminal hydrolase 4/11/15
MSNHINAPPQQHIRPYRYGVTLARDCSMADLKLALADVTGISQTNLMLAEIYENAIYDVIKDDAKKVSTIGSNDTIAAYETDSILEDDQRSNRVLYALATQFLIVRNKEGNLGRAKIGFPLMVVLDPQASCRDTWNRLWLQVDALVRQPGARRHIDYVDEQNQVQRHDLLAIRVLSNQGRPAPIFSTPDGAATSLLPHDCDERISDALQKFQAQFLFMAFEWRNPESQHGPSLIVRPKSFVTFEDHSSMLEVVEVERAKKKHQRSVTLDQCFEMFTKPERLDEKNMWYCSQCKRHVRAMKTMKLWRLPNILMIHLKRFEFKNTIRQEKLDAMVEFPLEGLNMAKHCSGPNLACQIGSDTVFDGSFDANYDLFGVVNHFGRMGFGHYTSFCRQWDEEELSTQWHMYDDSKVQPAEPSDVSSPAAYILFYRRRHFH